jgi:ABC-type lipoprotein release transport system permease subunit
MTFTRLLLRNLLWHWRGNAAVLAGVAVGTAVLTGALLVGDSLRGSLRETALGQLGWVDESLVASRFFRDELAAKLPAAKVCPVILLQSAATTEGPEPARVNKVTILAVDQRFWPAEDMPMGASFWQGSSHGVALNAALARRLQAKVGDVVVLLLQSADNVPRETLLGRRATDDVLSRLVVTVKAILPETGMGRFTLRPSPEPPLNAFVPLGLIQGIFDADKNTYPLKGRCNAMLAGGAKASLAGALREHLTLDDWNLSLRTPADRARDLFKLLAAGEDQWPSWTGKLRKYRWNGRIPGELAGQASAAGELTLEQFVDFFQQHHGYVSLESSQVFIEPAAVRAASRAAAANGWKEAPTFAYMVDTLSDGTHEAPYAIVAALDPDLPMPLGPMQAPGAVPLRDGEILLARWPGCALQAEPGAPVTLSFDVPDAGGKLERRQMTMKFAGWVLMQGVADDAALTPRFEGITDRLSIRDWASNLPFTVDRRRLKRADNEYWDRYRSTPKAYVTLATGQQLWGSRFGDVTSVRLAPPAKTEAASLARHLLEQLDPASGGFVFDNVKEGALAAGEGSNDFGMLFLSFSFFLIVAALLLVGLLFRLSLDRRASAMGLLLAVGWRRKAVRRLALAEGTILAAIGALAGLFAAILYAKLLLQYLEVLWPGGLSSRFLQLHVTGQTLVIGFVASLIVSVLTIWWATRMLARLEPRALLAGETVEATAQTTSRSWISLSLLIVAILAAVLSLAAGALAQDHEAKAGGFFGSGVFILTALLTALWRWMRHTVALTLRAKNRPSLTRLAIRNAARHPLRSLLTVGLLASASFIVVAVEAFHRDPTHDFLEKTGGSGGFAWIGEATVPIFQDLNTGPGRPAVHLPADLRATFVPFRVQAGDDTSCLNLYRPRQPRVVGVPRALTERGGFQWASDNVKVSNHWRLLLEHPQGGAIPAIGEANTVQWMLKSGLDKEINIYDGRGEEVRLGIVALLQDSVFQGELLISHENFLKLFPRQEGWQFFLIDAPSGEVGQKVRREVETALADYGFSMTPAQERLQSYLDVENTYLATFQALGGLGLLLGTLGLGIVLIRTVNERRGELALLRALGFRRSRLGWLVLAENVWLLGLGLLFGCVAAAVAVAPFVVSHGGTVLQPRLFLQLGLVVVIGLTVGALAMKAALRAPLLPALRRE